MTITWESTEKVWIGHDKLIAKLRKSVTSKRKPGNVHSLFILAGSMCPSGLPQGSVLGPLLFSIYTSPVSNIVNSVNLQHHQYADNTQLFISLSPTGYSADIQSHAPSFHLALMVLS